MFEIFRKHKLSRLLLGFVAVMVFLIIPLTIIQVQNKQDIRQRAQSVSPLSLSIDAPATAQVNKPFTVTINLNNAEKKDISGFDITIAFAKELVLSPFVASTSVFSIVIKDQSVPGTFRLVGVNPSLDSINASVIKLGEMEFKAPNTPATTKIFFEKANVTGAGGLIFSDTLNNLPAVSASVEIVSLPTAPTLTPTPTLAPGSCNRAVDCVSPPSSCKLSENAQCVSGVCTFPRSKLNGTLCQLDSGDSGSCLAGVCAPGSPTLCGGIQGNFEFKCQTGCLPGQSKTLELTCPTNQFCCGTALPTPTPFLTPTPTPSGQCADSDCRNKNLICAPGSACLQDPSSLVKSCSCRSTTQPSPTPVPTPKPGSALLTLSLKVPGIGTASAENLPRTKSRPVKVIVRTAAKDIEKEGVIIFSPIDGTFKTDPKRPVDLGTSIPLNTLLDLVIKADFFKGFVSDVSLSPGPNPAPQTPILQVGLDDSQNVDAVSYFNVLTGCFGTKPCENKLAADLNDDGSVDGIDFNIFLKSIRSISNK